MRTEANAKELAFRNLFKLKRNINNRIAETLNPLPFRPMLHLLTARTCVLWGVGHDGQLRVHLTHLGRGVRGLRGLLHHVDHLPGHDELRLRLHQGVSTRWTLSVKSYFVNKLTVLIYIQSLIIFIIISFLSFIYLLFWVLEEYFTSTCNCKALIFLSRGNANVGQ